MRQALWLVKNGVPLDVAFALEPAEASAWSVMFGEMTGSGRFDWEAGAWEELDG